MGAIAGGPGDSPEHGSPLYICRAVHEGGLQPGKWVKGNCKITFNSKEVVARDYEVAYGEAEWGPYNGNARGLLQTGNEADGAPLYSCRVRYQNHGYQPGRLANGRCAFPYDGKEVVQKSGFEALYRGGDSLAAGSSSKGGSDSLAAKSSGKGSGGFWAKMKANAEYQQDKQNGQNPDDLAPLNSKKQKAGQDESKNGSKPLCKMGDDGVELQRDGSWAGPNCIAATGSGKPAHPDNDKSDKSQSAQEKRAEFIEKNACMTTDGADKANQLAENCNKVTSGSHTGCNIQENTCDEIRKATQKGCWGLPAEAPDFCTKYQ